MKKFPEYNEHCWVILGQLIGACWFGRLVYLTEGEPSEVEFNAEQILERDFRKRDVIGFVHTHPNSQALPSATDQGTMHAWVTALGKPLVCGIHGNDGLKSFVYAEDESNAVQGRIFRVGRFVWGVNTIGG